jgi:protein PhnA
MLYGRKIMKLKQTPELHAFLSTYISDADPDTDEQAVRAFISARPAERQQQVIAQAKALLADTELPLEEFGTEANRWFGDVEEARAWLSGIVAILEGAQLLESSVVVKDSNGAPLAEGDSVQVIKDLKVKGGSSDLKRGTLIKKIHLMGDPENIECRVDGSTLVLKTCFLKKA